MWRVKANIFSAKRWALWAAWAGVLHWAASAAAFQDEAVNYLETSLSLRGSTGWINIPSATVAGEGTISAGIHRGFSKVNLSMFNTLEAGFFFDADKLGRQFEPYRNVSSWERFTKNSREFVNEAFRGQVKIKILDQDFFWFQAALGWEWQDPYLVVQRYFSTFGQIMAVAGYGNGRFNHGFGGISKTIFPGADFLVEYDGRGINFGSRILLAKNLVFLLAIQDARGMTEVSSLGDIIGRHLLFGVSYRERLW